MDCTICVTKTKVTAKLLCTFVFAYANCWFSDTVAQIFSFTAKNGKVFVMMSEQCPTHQDNPAAEYVFFIMKACPCYVYPLEPHFYIAKLGYAGVYLFFLFLLQNIDCGYSLEPPRRGGSNVYPQPMF